MNVKAKEALLAASTLANPAPAPADVTPVLTDLPARTPGPACDPSYIEPPTLAYLRAMANASPNYALLMAALDRIEKLQDSLLPFALHAMTLAQARMLLTAEGRATEPCGGTWVNGTKQINMQATEALFFDAADVYGRAACEALMMERFEKVQAGVQAQAEREPGTTEH